MNKQEFLSHLKNSLACLTNEQKAESLEYYSEMIDDLIEDGMSEEEAVATLGNVDEIASRIIAETPLPQLVKANVMPKRALKAWEIILLVLGSPIWLSLLIALLCIVFSVYITLWAVVITLVVVVLSLLVSLLAVVIAGFGFLFSKHLLHSVLLFGAGFVCAGLTLLFLLLVVYSFMGLVQLSKLCINLLKKPFMKKGEM